MKKECYACYRPTMMVSDTRRYVLPLCEPCSRLFALPFMKLGKRR